MCLLQTVLSVSAAEKQWYKWKVERKSDFAVMPAGINGGMHILTGCSEKPSIYINVRTAVRSLKYMATATESIAATSVM